jgi:GNAT superfamily N-acetyltransferase
MEFTPLTEAALPRAAALSGLVGWNQTEADWRIFLRHGTVRTLDDGDTAALAATAATLRYGPDLAWISMVLVRPDMRRRGLATALMRWAMDDLSDVRCVALDATPAGRAVYRLLGFRDLWGFTRWRLPDSLSAADPVPVRPPRAADWPEVLALDASCFGAPRDGLLRDFAARAPAFVTTGVSGRVTGALLARDGVRGPQLGPLLAGDGAAARALLAAGAAVLPGAVTDLREERLEAWLAAQGATRQRPFTRMVLGADPPGDPTSMLALAGPEFG